MAQGGDIFLDEIGDLPLSTQVKLLRVLEEKVVERVGESKAIPVDVRIISATNRDLPKLVERRAFRKDFYFRINVIPISLPPLRDRVEDIPVLAESFFRKMRLKSGRDITGIHNRTMDILMGYSWPGNVRELKSAFEYAFVTCHESILQPYHLPPDVLKEEPTGKDSEAAPPSKQEIRRRQLIEALQQAKGNQSVAAELLGISRVTVWNRMKRFGIKFERSLETTPEIQRESNSKTT
jgi:transcriptional regulator with PAS, ATPase and Fis domain